MTGLLAEPAGLNVGDETPPKHYDARWRLNRGGIVNVWYYYDTEFAFTGGRVIWRGANGSGKSRALELLFPYLLDGNRRAIDATGAGKVRLEDLMRAGSGDGSNRIGYLWIELVGVGDDGDVEYLTLGAHIRYSRSAAEARVLYFTTPLRVGEELRLIDDERLPLGRERLSELIGPDRLSETAEGHRERVRSQVFGLSGEAGRERFSGLLQLLHVLRNPDVGNRIDSGALPSILSDALPPLSERRSTAPVTSWTACRRFAPGSSAWRKPAATSRVSWAPTAATPSASCKPAASRRVAASSVARSTGSKAKRAQGDAEQAQSDHQQARSELTRLADEQATLSAQISGIRQSEQYRAAEDLDAREGQVRGLARAAESALAGAQSARGSEARAVRDANGRAGEVLEAMERAASTQVAVSAAVAGTGLTEPGPQPCGGSASEPAAAREAVRTGLRQQADAVREAPMNLTLSPADPAEAAHHALTLRAAAATRGSLVRARRQEALALVGQKREVDAAEGRADVDESRADDDARAAETAAVERDETAVALAHAWREWVARPATGELFGDQDWLLTAVAILLRDREALVGDEEVHPQDQLQELDAAAAEAAGPVRDELADGRARIELARRQIGADRDVLRAEQDELRAARDPLPATPPWHADGPGGKRPALAADRLSRRRRRQRPARDRRRVAGRRVPDGGGASGRHPHRGRRAGAPARRRAAGRDPPDGRAPARPGEPATGAAGVRAAGPDRLRSRVASGVGGGRRPLGKRSDRGCAAARGGAPHRCAGAGSGSGGPVGRDRFRARRAGRT